MYCFIGKLNFVAPLLFATSWTIKRLFWCIFCSCIFRCLQTLIMYHKMQDKELAQHQISILLFVAFACGLGMFMFTRLLGPQILAGKLLRSSWLWHLMVSISYFFLLLDNSYIVLRTFILLKFEPFFPLLSCEYWGRWGNTFLCTWQASKSVIHIHVVTKTCKHICTKQIN